jgi:hypothetical protein
MDAILPWITANKPLAIAALVGIYVASVNGKAIWPWLKAKASGLIPAIGTGAVTPDANAIADAYQLLSPWMTPDTRATVRREVADRLLMGEPLPNELTPKAAIALDALADLERGTAP